MKYILYTFTLLFLIMVLLYILLFTPIGNKALQPIVQNQINTRLPFEVKLDAFTLNMKEIEIRILLSETNSVDLKAKYNIFTQSIDGKYDAKFLNLVQFENLIGHPVSGRMQTQGDIRGNLEFLRLSGLVAVAQGGGSYSLDIKNLQIDSIVAQLQNMDMAELLVMANLPEYAAGRVFIQSDFDLSMAPQGSLKLFVKEGVLNEALLKEQFNIDLPPSHFVADMDIDLGATTTIDAVIDSKLAKIDIEATMIDEKIDAAYSVDVKYLEAFEPLLGKRFNGPLQINGNVIGEKENFAANLVSDVAGGVSEYVIAMKNSQLHTIKGQSKQIDFEKLFYLLELPQYAVGKSNLYMDLDEMKNNLNGTIKTDGSATVNNSYLQEAFGKSLQHNRFSFQAQSSIEKSVALSQILLHMEMATLDLIDLTFAIKENQMQGKYRLDIDDLSKFEGLIDKELQGKFLIDGEVLYQFDDEKTLLQIDGLSQSLGGEVFVDLLNSNLKLDANDILIEKLLHMLKTPVVLAGKTQANLDYEIESKTGKLSADFLESRFTQSFFTDAIREYTGRDLSNKKFDRADLAAKISGDDIVSEFVFHMDDIILKSEKLHINTITKRIRGNVSLILKNQRYNIKVNGTLDNLQEAFDYEDLLRQEVQRQIEKKAQEFIQKELGDDLFQKFKGLF